MNERIAITGVGVVSTFGVGRQTYWDNIRRGVSGTRAITEFDASTYPCQVAAAVPPVSIEDALPLAGENGNGDHRADPRRYSRAALFGVIAAREAWNDARLPFGQPNAGVIIGTGGGGIDVGERQYQDFFTSGGKHVTPYAIAVGICGMVSSEISISLGLHGISHVLSTGCTSSTDAIGYADDAPEVRRGRRAALRRHRRVRAPRHDLRLLAHARGVDALQRSAGCRPRGRSIAAGTGSCSARARGWWRSSANRVRARAARAIYATIDGYASTCDAYHRVQMDPDGEQIVRCMTGAVERSGRALEEIGYVNYHGTSTLVERRHRVALHAQGLRPRTREQLPGSSTKSMIGHPQGASGAAGVVTTALALSCGFLPPTINLHRSGPELRSRFPRRMKAARRGPRRRSATALGLARRIPLWS